MIPKINLINSLIISRFIHKASGFIVIASKHFQQPLYSEKEIESTFAL